MPQSSSTPPTAVLVHGAFADSSSWNGVVTRLSEQNIRTVAAANPLRGLAHDAGYVRELLASVDGPVVLVGHSYGGAVISAAAVGADNVKALVYVAAFLPEPGESAADLSGRFPGSTLGETLREVPVTLADGSKATDCYIDVDRFHGQFAADVPEEVARVMAVTQRPITAEALAEKATEAAWKTLPSWVLVSQGDQNIPPQAQSFMAERAGAQTVTVEASHAVSVSQPDAVAGLITEAVQGTS
ncbi:alpha/beta fold hydrolase [Streptomyces justiciae]|uniref:Alpha/beta hydrolase n=1 Tax=Streptomyces justiciae TaxID=2780140 RepID=A0ABU3M3Y0_9ACTN|nr:alpha/beta hydrolase [Streptomyces justiciae]MDT7845659.1 alpha/beta hydrolase [Streptomyces justiciae]